MEKLVFLYNYMYGTVVFTNFISSFCYELEPEEKNTINDLVQSEWYNAASLGLSINMILNLKEILVTKTNNPEKFYESNIIDKELAKCVEDIATKTSDGFLVDGFLFKDAASLVAFIRNKLAHGDFLADFNEGLLILNNDNHIIKIDIQKLSVMLAKGYQRFMISSFNGTYVKDYCTISRPTSLRGQKILNQSELKYLLKRVRYNKTVFSSRDNSDIPDSVTKKFNMIINTYERENMVPGPEMEAVAGLYNCNCSYSHESLSSEYIDNEYKNIWNMIKDCDTFDDQMEILGRQLMLHTNPDYYKTFFAIGDCMDNAAILQTVIEKKTVDKNRVKNGALKRYGRYKFDPYTIMSSYISCFNSMFSYGYDDIYKGKSGLDYGLLELDMIKDCFVSVDTNVLDAKNDQVKALKRELVKRKEAMNKEIMNLNNVQNKNNNPKAISIIQNNIINKEKKVNEIQELLDKLNVEIGYLLLDRKCNSKYYTNEAIIEGMRNSIAHGRYNIVAGSSFDDYYIEFKDYDESGKLTFEGKLDLNGFRDLINLNYIHIVRFIEEKMGQGRAKKLV